MEFLIAVVILVLGAFFGYKYYQAKVARETAPDVLDLAATSVAVKLAPLETVKVEVGNVSLPEAEKKIEAVKEEIKKAKPKKAPKSPAKAEVAEKRTRKGGKFAGDDKTTPDVNEAFKDGKAPSKKKKPTMKVAK